MLARKNVDRAPVAPLKAPWLKQKEAQRLKDIERDRRARESRFAVLADDDSDDDEPKIPTKENVPEISAKRKAVLLRFRKGTLNWADVESDDEIENVEF